MIVQNRTNLPLRFVAGWLSASVTADGAPRGISQVQLAASNAVSARPGPTVMVQTLGLVPHRIGSDRIG